MNDASMKKLLAAGFRIIRCADFPTIRIKEYTGLKCTWKSVEDKFPSKVARNRRFVELLKDPKIVED